MKSQKAFIEREYLMTRNALPIPDHFDSDKVGQVWRVPYQERAEEANKWATQYKIQTASQDKFRICLLLVDVQNTFCIPEFELYVGGRSGTGAVDDNRRLCEFIYRNIDVITQVCPTMDTHQSMQIFHSIFLVNERGEHPAPFTLISVEDVENGIWKFNPKVAAGLNIDVDYGQEFLRHYTHQLQVGGKYDLTIWPYHAMLGGIGHALVSAVEEAIFFHGIARYCLPDFQVKGSNAFTENYSVISPEVLEDAQRNQIAEKNAGFLRALLEFDAVIIAGQAKSHCVAWTIDDLLSEIGTWDKKNAAFQRFSDAGMHVCRSTDALKSWSDIAL
jgi:nicotinamidase-related amidase